MRKVIATIRLERGQTGYYDKLTNIHLTLTNPIGYVYEGMNVSVLKRSVKAKRIGIVSGSLEPLKETKQQPIPTPQQIVEQQIKVEEVIAPIVEENVVEEPIVEEVVEEEVVEEQPKKKRKNKKATEELVVEEVVKEEE